MVCVVCGMAFSADCPECLRPNRGAVPHVRGVVHPHHLQWGDSYALYLYCVRCGVGFPPNATVLDVMGECSARIGGLA